MREPQVHKAPSKMHLRGFLQKLTWEWGDRILQLGAPPPSPLMSQWTQCYPVPTMFFGKIGSGAWHQSCPFSQWMKASGTPGPSRRRATSHVPDSLRTHRCSPCGVQTPIFPPQIQVLPAEPSVLAGLLLCPQAPYFITAFIRTICLQWVVLNGCLRVTSTS